MTGDGTVDQVLAGAATWAIVTGDGPSCLESLGPVVDHVITDPPYEIEAHTRGRRQGGKAGRSLVAPVVAPLDFEPMTRALRYRAGEAIARTCRRWVLVFCQAEGAALWREALEPMRHVRIGAWIKPDAQPQYSGDRPGVGWEAIEIAHAPTGRMQWKGGGRVAVWRFNSQDLEQRDDSGHKTQRLHRTQKPLRFMRYLVELFTDHGDLVADPFAGVGTTILAAIQAGRRAIGIEIHPAWAELGRERCRAWESGSTMTARRAGQLTILERWRSEP